MVAAAAIIGGICLFVLGLYFFARWIDPENVAGLMFILWIGLSLIYFLVALITGQIGQSSHDEEYDGPSCEHPNAC